MSLDMTQKFVPSWEGYPPHMSRDDYQLWIKQKDNLLQNAINVYYDVGLGGDQNNIHTDRPELQKAWTRLTQKRLDVLIETPKEWIIVELRHQSTGSEIGRLLIYKELFEIEKPDSKPAKVILVTGRYDKIVEEIAAKQGIIYIYQPL